jgi:translation initiation factor 5B
MHLLTRDGQNTSIAVVAASRLVFAVARDGVLPGSKWISQVTSDGQPRNAVTVMFLFGAAILCTILPSQVAFTSLVSAGAVPTIAAYGLIALLRLTMTPNSFKSSSFKLGKFRKPFYLAAALFNGLVLVVSGIVVILLLNHLTCPSKVMLSPFVFPVTPNTFNFVSGAIHVCTSCNPNTLHRLASYSGLSPSLPWPHGGLRRKISG